MKSDDKVDIAGDKSSLPAAEKTYSDAEVGHGDVESVETTKRGLKARHAQMIALGGTIGWCSS